MKKSEIIEAEADWLKKARENDVHNPSWTSPEFRAGIECAEGWLRHHAKMARNFEEGEARARAKTCPTCNGVHPVTGVKRRETAGLVCQSCGWDYGRDGEP